MQRVHVQCAGRLAWALHKVERCEKESIIQFTRGEFGRVGKYSRDGQTSACSACVPSSPSLRSGIGKHLALHALFLSIT